MLEFSLCNAADAKVWHNTTIYFYHRFTSCWKYLGVDSILPAVPREDVLARLQNNKIRFLYFSSFGHVADSKENSFRNTQKNCLCHVLV